MCVMKSRIAQLLICAGEVESAQGLWENSPWGKMERGIGRLERGNSFVGGRAPADAGSGAGSSPSRDGLVAIVDPFSTGAHLAALAAKLGYGVVRVFSIWDSPVAALIQEGVDVDYFATVQFNDQAPDQDAATNQCVRDLLNLPRQVIAVLPGAETGVELADRLAHRMGLRGNGEVGSFARCGRCLCSSNCVAVADAFAPQAKQVCNGRKSPSLWHTRREAAPVPLSRRAGRVPPRRAGDSAGKGAGTLCREASAERRQRLCIPLCVLRRGPGGFFHDKR